MSEGSKKTGTVKWFNDAKGFGFIAQEDGTDIFVHHSNIHSQGFRTLKEGQVVVFEVEQGKKGLEAIDVEMAAGPHGGGGGLDD